MNRSYLETLCFRSNGKLFTTSTSKNKIIDAVLNSSCTENIYSHCTSGCELNIYPQLPVAINSGNEGNIFVGEFYKFEDDKTEIKLHIKSWGNNATSSYTLLQSNQNLLVEKYYAKKKCDYLLKLGDSTCIKEITALGKQYGIVTKHTSMIVLESLSEYLKHEIEPPASLEEIRQQYRKIMEDKKRVWEDRIYTTMDVVHQFYYNKLQWWESSSLENLVQKQTLNFHFKTEDTYNSAYYNVFTPKDMVFTILGKRRINNNLLSNTMPPMKRRKVKIRSQAPRFFGPTGNINESTLNAHKDDLFVLEMTKNTETDRVTTGGKTPRKFASKKAKRSTGGVIKPLSPHRFKPNPSKRSRTSRKSSTAPEINSSLNHPEIDKIPTKRIAYKTIGNTSKSIPIEEPVFYAQKETRNHGDSFIQVSPYTNSMVPRGGRGGSGVRISSGRGRGGRGRLSSGGRGRGGRGRGRGRGKLVVNSRRVGPESCKNDSITRSHASGGWTGGNTGGKGISKDCDIQGRDYGAIKGPGKGISRRIYSSDSESTSSSDVGELARNAYRKGIADSSGSMKTVCRNVAKRKKKNKNKNIHIVYSSTSESSQSSSSLSTTTIKNQIRKRLKEGTYSEASTSQQKYQGKGLSTKPAVRHRRILASSSSESDYSSIGDSVISSSSSTTNSYSSQDSNISEMDEDVGDSVYDQRRQRLRKLAIETIESDNDPYFMKIHLGPLKLGQNSMSLDNIHCGNLLYLRGLKEKAIVEYSNLAEIATENICNLRLLSWKMDELKSYGISLRVRERIYELCPYEPNSCWELARSLMNIHMESLNLETAYRIVDLFQKIFLHKWGNRFSIKKLELIVLSDLNRFLAFLKHKDETQKLKYEAMCRDRLITKNPFIDCLLGKFLSVDLRILLLWNCDITDIELHVTEPTGQRCHPFQETTTTGGRLSNSLVGLGPIEYLTKFIMPGSYKISAKLFHTTKQISAQHPISVAAYIYINYGDVNKEITWVKTGELSRIGQVVVLDDLLFDHNKQLVQ
eukprot:TRINITY_DN2170_c0_g2_i1.p1 TRINITY_DN2170_c0_g2~~TRINITY_DN2170_c0_g2_i1.p1  ORF type:complete len:1023 (-),score=230.63 TRINITY_DN2170_c0_g2_i1:9-3077(-)